MLLAPSRRFFFYQRWDGQEACTHCAHSSQGDTLRHYCQRRHSPVLHPGVTLAGSLRVVLGQEAAAAGPLGDPNGPALAGFLLLRGVHKDVLAGAECQLVHILGLVLKQGPQGLEERRR